MHICSRFDISLYFPFLGVLRSPNFISLPYYKADNFKAFLGQNIAFVTIVKSSNIIKNSKTNFANEKYLSCFKLIVLTHF